MLARGHGDMGTREAELPCKGANAASPRAKVQMFLKGVGVGSGLEIREAWRLRGSVEQRDPALKGGGIGKPDS